MAHLVSVCYWIATPPLCELITRCWRSSSGWWNEPVSISFTGLAKYNFLALAIQNHQNCPAWPCPLKSQLRRHPEKAPDMNLLYAGESLSTARYRFDCPVQELL